METFIFCGVFEHGHLGADDLISNHEPNHVAH